MDCSYRLNRYSAVCIQVIHWPYRFLAAGAKRPVGRQQTTAETRPRERGQQLRLSQRTAAKATLGLDVVDKHQHGAGLRAYRSKLRAEITASATQTGDPVMKKIGTESFG